MAHKGEGKWLREAPLAERLAFRSKRNPKTGCILWLGSLKYTDGYGRIGVNGKTVGAHVVAYTLAKGPVPKGLELDHLKGHPYSGGNLFYNRAGDRLCRTCSREWARIYRNSQRRDGNADHSHQ